MENARIKSNHFTYKNQKRLWAAIFLLPWIIGFLLMFIVPMFNSFRYSFYHLKANSSGQMEFTWLGIQNYYYALNVAASSTTEFKMEALITLQEVLINIPVIIIFSLFIATVLNTEFKGRAIVRAIFFIPVILNSTAVTSALSKGSVMSDILQGADNFGKVFQLEEYLMRAGVGQGLVTFIVSLIDRIYSILSLSGVPILLFLASIQSIPRHLYEAAEIEGATKYEMFWLITLPNITPHLLTVAIFILIDTFISSPISLFIDSFPQTEWGLRSAMSWLYVAIVAIVLVVIVSISKIFKWGELNE